MADERLLLARPSNRTTKQINTDLAVIDRELAKVGKVGMMYRLLVYAREVLTAWKAG